LRITRLRTFAAAFWSYVVASSGVQPGTVSKAGTAIAATLSELCSAVRK
jgi:hypothetical protein